MFRGGRQRHQGQRAAGQTRLYVQDQLKWDRLVLLLGERKDWHDERTSYILPSPSDEAISQQHYNSW